MCTHYIPITFLDKNLVLQGNTFQNQIYTNAKFPGWSPDDTEFEEVPNLPEYSSYLISDREIWNPFSRNSPELSNNVGQKWLFLLWEEGSGTPFQPWEGWHQGRNLGEDWRSRRPSLQDFHGPGVEPLDSFHINKTSLQPLRLWHLTCSEVCIGLKEIET